MAMQSAPQHMSLEQYLLLANNSGRRYEYHEGEVRWMEVSDWLNRTATSQKPVKQILFEGDRFDVMSVRHWRNKMLGKGS